MRSLVGWGRLWGFRHWTWAFSVTALNESASGAPVPGGEIISGGAWTVLTGEGAFTNGAIIRFIDRDTAIGWYNSDGYQATLGNRSLGIDCRFRLLG